MHNHQDYATIVGRLRALEPKLLHASLLERLLDSKTAEEAYRTLNDFAFLAPHVGDHPVNDFQKVLTSGLSDMLELLVRLAPYPDAIAVLLFKYDFHNLKVVLKARLTQHGFADVAHALIPLGSVDFEIWEAFALNGPVPVLTEGMKATIADAETAYENSQDPQEVDLIVDRHHMEAVIAIVDTLNSPLLCDYFKRLIDFTNLKSFIRAKVAERDTAYLERVLITGGHAGTAIFGEHFDKDLDGFRSFLEKKMHSDGMIEVLDRYAEEGTLLVVEKKIHDLLQAFMMASSRIPFGPEPVFAFFWRLENNLQIIRTVLVGKLNQLETPTISKQVLSI